MSASPRPTRNAIARSHSPADPNRDHVYTNGTYLNPQNSELYRNRRSVSPNKLDTESIPLIDNNAHNRPPLANPEMDDASDDRQIGEQPGVDDGFFSNRANEDGPVLTDVENVQPASLAPTDNGIDDIDSGRVFPHRRVSPYNPNRGGPISPFPDVELATNPDILIAESIPDINVYQHKKTLAQGMMDLALFSANANQLRYVLDSDTHPYYYPGIVLITISLMFQVAIGVGLIWNSRYNVKDEKEICIANKINNFTVIGIFLVTVINVFISAFGVASVQTVAAPAAIP